MFEQYEFNGHVATVVVPDSRNGKWIWKTEFFTAFDKAEQVLCEEYGYTRVYYQISDLYGCDEAVELMRKFFDDVTERYGLERKAILFGFSRGGLYAFNFANAYPDLVSKIYLDAPVLNLKSWPPKGSEEYFGMLESYHLTEKEFETAKISPIDKLKEFASKDIPVLIVAGGVDKTVPHLENCQIMVDYYNEIGKKIEYILKPDCDHHPHSLEDGVTPIVEFVGR